MRNIDWAEVAVVIERATLRSAKVLMVYATKETVARRQPVSRW
jgi:hypothetical protein